MPAERCADPVDDFANLFVDDAELDDVAAAGAFRDLAVDMAGDEPAVIEDRLRAFERAVYRGLHQKAFGKRVLLIQPCQQRIARRLVADAPHTGACGTEGGLDEIGIWPRGSELLDRADQRGRR